MRFYLSEKLNSELRLKTVTSRGALAMCARNEWLLILFLQFYLLKKKKKT